MGCACKNKENRVLKLIPDIDIPKVDRKGLMYYIKLIGSTLLNVIMKIFLIALAMVIAIPFLFVVLVSSLLLNKNIKVKLPKKLIKQIRKLDNG